MRGPVRCGQSECPHAHTPQQGVSPCGGWPASDGKFVLPPAAARYAVIAVENDPQALHGGEVPYSDPVSRMRPAWPNVSRPPG